LTHRLDPTPVTGRWTDLVRHDLPASLVVFLVAIPLSLGIAVASGAPIMAGLVAAVVGGVVAGTLGGSPLQVSGPAAGLTVVVAEIVAEFGWAVTCAVTVAAGLLQILLGTLRVARVALAVSPVVVHGMLAGIGVTIAVQQVHVLLGGPQQPGTVEGLVALPGAVLSAHLPAVLVGGLVITLLLFWSRIPAMSRRLPGALVAIVSATLLAAAAGLDVARVELPGDVLDAIGPPLLPDGRLPAFAIAVVTIALVASVESLLSAVAVDRMHHGPRTRFDRELLGQGAANVASGALGGLPVTGVIVRSATNVAAGARSRASTILHGVWALLFSVLLVGAVEQIPFAALAGLLVVIGLQLVKVAHIRTARRDGELAVYAATTLGVVLLGLLEGVVAGIVLALVLVLVRVVRAQVHAERAADDPTGRRWRVTVTGSLTFLGLPRLTRVLAEVPERALVTVRLGVEYVDGPASDIIHDWIRRHEANGGAVAIVRTLRPGHDVLHRPRCAAGRLRRTPPPVPVAPGPR
jgi:carbonic anhydrase